MDLFLECMGNAMVGREHVATIDVASLARHSQARTCLSCTHVLLILTKHLGVWLNRQETLWPVNQEEDLALTAKA